MHPTRGGTAGVARRVVAVVVLSTIGGAALTGCGADPTTPAERRPVGGADRPAAVGGPVRAEEGNRLGLAVPAGSTFSYGVPVVVNESDEPAIIESVRPLGVSPELRFVGAIALGDERRDHLVSRELGFPPPPSWWRSGRRPARVGASGVLVPGSGPTGGDPSVELVLGFRTPTTDGRRQIRGVRVAYRIDGRRYVRDLPNAFSVCVGRKRCRLPATSPFSL